MFDLKAEIFAINLNYFYRENRQVTVETKSILHDATPSWNGYNYQGKVGLYVCLEKILIEARKGVDAPTFVSFLSEHHIEYEWIEDFAIKKNDTYLSLHQVKHKGENRFKDHVEAIATILYRKNAVISDSDIFKYFNLSRLKSGYPARIKKILRNRIVSNNLVDSTGKLDQNWKANLKFVDHRYRDNISKCFGDFELLAHKAFDSSITYFHTAEKIESPIEDISNIQGIPSQLVAGLVNPKSLSCRNIFLSFDVQNAYELALSDDELNHKLDKQIDELLHLLHTGETFLKEDIKLYKTALCALIDQNLVKRHQHIRDKVDNHIPYLMRTKPSIFFESIIVELNKSYREHNSLYWNLVCRQNFETAYKEKLNELNYLLSNSMINYDLYSQYKTNLELLRINIIEQFLPNNCVSFLIKIYPHCTKNGLLDHQFYNAISEPIKIKTVFLNFIQKVMKPLYQLTLICSENTYIYQPTCIDFNESDELQKEIAINKARKGLTENIGSKSSIQKNVDYIVVNSTKKDDVISAGIQKITEVDSYEQTASGRKESDKFTERKDVNFVDSRKALGDING